MKKQVLSSLLLVVIVFILGPVNLVAQADEGDVPQFLNETLQYLQQAGWREAELEQLQKSAKEQNWDEVESADPEVVAMALQLAHRNRQQLEGSENADLAFQLAKMTQTMSRLGFERREIARASFEGTRDALRSIEQFRKNTGQDTMKDSKQLREQLRERIKNRINTAMENRVRIQEKASPPIKPGSPHTGGDNAPDVTGPGPGRPDTSD